MLKRLIAKKILKQLASMPAVALLGARQVGKTTIAKAIAKDIKSIYLDLESPEDLVKLTDPGSFLRLHSDKLVTISTFLTSYYWLEDYNPGTQM